MDHLSLDAIFGPLPAGAPQPNPSAPNPWVHDGPWTYAEHAMADRLRTAPVPIDEIDAYGMRRVLCLAVPCTTADGRRAMRIPAGTIIPARGDV